MEEVKQEVEKQEEKITTVPEPEKKIEAVLTISDLEKKLTSLQKVKDTIETNYYQILGQINFVAQQIDELRAKQNGVKS